jgi:hypothetical protein
MTLTIDSRSARKVRATTLGVNQPKPSGAAWKQRVGDSADMVCDYESNAAGLEFYGQASRPISTSQLNGLPHLHLWPINLVVYKGSLVHPKVEGIPHLEGGFALRCIQRLSFPDIATQRCPWRDNWYTRGPSIPVLSY